VKQFNENKRYDVPCQQKFQKENNKIKVSLI